MQQHGGVTYVHKELHDWGKKTLLFAGLTEYAFSSRVGKTAGVKTRVESNVTGWQWSWKGKQFSVAHGWQWYRGTRLVAASEEKTGGTFLWQQQSSAERADRMTVQAISTSSKLISTRLKLIWTAQCEEDTERERERHNIHNDKRSD